MDPPPVELGTEPDQLLLGSANAAAAAALPADYAAGGGFAAVGLEVFEALDRADIPRSRWNHPGFKYAVEVPLQVQSTQSTTLQEVRAIPRSAFAKCGGMVAVKLPPPTVEIGDDAFAGCAGLVGVAIPAGVVEIGRNAFGGCTGLAAVELPPGMTTVNAKTFTKCTGLTRVVLPGSIIAIGAHAFSGCSGITHLAIPASVTQIGSDAFNGCTGLQSVDLPPGLSLLRRGTFAGCSSLTEIVLPASITEIHTFALYDCNALVSITVPAGVTVVGEHAFFPSTPGRRMLIAPDPTITSIPVLRSKAFLAAVRGNQGRRGPPLVASWSTPVFSVHTIGGDVIDCALPAVIEADTNVHDIVWDAITTALDSPRNELYLVINGHTCTALFRPTISVSIRLVGPHAAAQPSSSSLQLRLPTEIGETAVGTRPATVRDAWDRIAAFFDISPSSAALLSVGGTELTDVVLDELQECCVIDGAEVTVAVARLSALARVSQWMSHAWNL